MQSFPSFVAHADWGVNAQKRWRAIAVLDEYGRYQLDGPDLVGTLGTASERMGIPQGHQRSAVFCFDFPIGVPRRYAELAGIESFKSVLMDFGQGLWERFFDVAERSEEINLQRPFYPAGASVRGQHTRQALFDALQLEANEMLRRCDEANSDRRAANPLFWTLGGAQVGKGALSGWREMVVPTLRDDAGNVGLWPFDGSLSDLWSRLGFVIAETYPAEFYKPLGVRFGKRDDTGKWGKRQQHDRKAQAQALKQAASAVDAVLSDRLHSQIEDGFGSRTDGEDRFDAVVGLLGMLHVIQGRTPEGVPLDDQAVLSVEGWILGRPSARTVER